MQPALDRREEAGGEEADQSAQDDPRRDAVEHRLQRHGGGDQHRIEAEESAMAEGAEGERIEQRAGEEADIIGRADEAELGGREAAQLRIGRGQREMQAAGREDGRGGRLQRPDAAEVDGGWHGAA